MIPKLIDTHCHLNFPDFDADPSMGLGAGREEVIKRTLEQDIWMINIGTDLKSSKESIGLAEKHELAPHGGGIFASVGLHPTDRECKRFDIDKYRELAKYSKVVAIGECGIDMFRRERSDMERQKEIFKKQIELAVELNKPLVIHCRDAHSEVIDILKSYFLNRKSEYNGNVHFFSGTWQEAEQYLDLGFSLSFTGVITFTNAYDNIIRGLPLEKIMVETDAPFVAPAPYRGRRSEPLHVKEVAKRIAEIKNISYEEVAQATTQNAVNFFRLSH
jgi:TatD DNase family protein